MNSSNGPSSRPSLARFLIRPREYRHPDVWLKVRLACALFNLGLGILFISFGVWEGVIPLAASALIFRTRYILRQTSQS